MGGGGIYTFLVAEGDGGTAGGVTTCPSPKKGRNLTRYLRDY